MSSFYRLITCSRLHNSLLPDLNESLAPKSTFSSAAFSRLLFHGEVIPHWKLILCGIKHLFRPPGVQTTRWHQGQSQQNGPSLHPAEDPWELGGLWAGAGRPVGWLPRTEPCWITEPVTAITQQIRTPRNQPCSSGLLQPQALMTQQRSSNWWKGSPNVWKTCFVEVIWSPVWSKNKETVSWNVALPSVASIPVL